MVLPVGIAPTTRRFEAGRSGLLSYGSMKDEKRKWVCRGGYAPPSPQCHCGDLLLNYRLVNRNEMAAPDGFAPPTSCFKGSCAETATLHRNKRWSSAWVSHPALPACRVGDVTGCLADGKDVWLSAIGVVEGLGIAPSTTGLQPTVILNSPTFP